MKKLILTIAVFSFISFISCKNKTQGQTKSSTEEKEQNSDNVESSTKQIKLDNQLNNQTEKENKQPVESVEISAIKNVANTDNKLENSIKLTDTKKVHFEGINVGEILLINLKLIKLRLQHLITKQMRELELVIILKR